MNSAPRRGPVEIVEVGPRDGLQNEDTTLGIDTRVDLISRLVEQGICRLEAVSFVRPDRVPQMAGAEEVMAQVPGRDDVTYIGLVLNRMGAERAAATACTQINIVVPVTNEFSTRNQNATVEVMLDHAAGAVAVAREAHMTATVTLAVAFGCPFAGEVHIDEVAKLVDRVADIGIDELAFADTIGVGVPSQVRAMTALVRADARIPALRFHFHNTRNTGYANAFAAADVALTSPDDVLALDASVGGFGGCPFAPAATGNIATEDLAYMLRREGISATGPEHLDLPAMSDTAHWLSTQLSSPVQGLIARAGDFNPNADEGAP